MATVEQHNEQLVLRAKSLENAVRQYANLAAMIALNHGKKKKGFVEYRLTKSQREAFNKRVVVRELKTGGLVIEVHEPKEENATE
jgi:hypothetical protein